MNWTQSWKPKKWPKKKCCDVASLKTYSSFSFFFSWFSWCVRVYTQTHTDTHRYRKVVSKCVCRCINFSCQGWNLGLRGCVVIQYWRLARIFIAQYGRSTRSRVNQHKRRNNQYMWSHRRTAASDSDCCRSFFLGVALSSTSGAARRCLRVSTVFWQVSGPACAMRPLLDSLEAIDQSDPFVFQPFQTLSISITLLWQKIEFPLMHFYVV